jgi:HEAT repeat protein
MTHVFISYHHEDRQLAQVLHNNLEEAGISAWMDPEIRAGEIWRGEIDEAIRKSSTLLVIISAAAVKSLYVNYEWAFALGAGIKVIPLLRGIRAEEMHPRLAGFQALDFTDPLARPWNELFAALKGVAPKLSSILEQAAAALQSLNSAERLQAVDTIAQMSDPAAVEMLRGACRHTVWDVRYKAALALAEIKDSSAIPVLLEFFLKKPGQGEEEANEAWKNMNVITALGSAAVPALIQSLKNPIGLIRTRAAQALETLQDDSALPALIEALQDKEAEVRAAVLEAIGKFGSRVSVDVVIPCLNDDSASVKIAAASTLNRIGDGRASVKLTSLLTDSNSEVRSAAAEALVNLADSMSIPALIRSLKDEDRLVRGNAAKILGKFKAGEAVPALLEATQTEEAWSRARAFEALQSIGDENTVQGLCKLMLDHGKLNRIQAAETLCEIRHHAAMPAFLDEIRDEEDDPIVRGRAALGLGKIGGSAAIPVLVKLLEDEHSFVRALAAQGLGETGDPAVIPVLIKMLEDKDYDVRELVVRALGQIGDPAAIPALTRLLEHEESNYVQFPAKKVLEELTVEDKRRRKKLQKT